MRRNKGRKARELGGEQNGKKERERREKMDTEERGFFF